MSWYAISSPANSQDGQDSGEVEVSIYDEIGFGGVTAKQFVSDLRKLKGEHIHLRINSVGGSVIEGAAIYNALRRHQGGLTVHVDGLAASMASVIAMAGEEVLMAGNSMLMIHNPWSMAMGDAEDLRKEASILDKLKATLVNAYVRKTGQERAQIETMMDEETWLDATEALAMKFVDGIEDDLEAAASITPAAARDRFDNFANSMARKSSRKKPAPVEPVAAEAVDSAENIMQADANIEAAAEVAVDETPVAVDAPATEEVAAPQVVEAPEAPVVDEAKAALESELVELKAALADALDEISTLRAASKSAGAQAAAIVASVGIDPVVAVPAQPELTAAQIFNSLTGAEAVEYYRANKREIVASLY